MNEYEYNFRLIPHPGGSDSPFAHIVHRGLRDIISRRLSAGSLPPADYDVYWTAMPKSMDPGGLILLEDSRFDIIYEVVPREE